MIRAIAIAVFLSATAAFAGPWDGYEPPRLADGTPDLQGIWTNASITALERPAYFPALTISADQAAEWEAGVLQDALEEAEPTDP
ncbi:MAG: hypothetical protein AAF439_02915, partial [Pseudomonadota bacterium]